MKMDDSILFRRRLNPDLAEQWEKMWCYLSNINLSSSTDVIYCGLDESSKFSTKYMYKSLEKPLVGCHYKWIWGLRFL